MYRKGDVVDGDSLPKALRKIRNLDHGVVPPITRGVCLADGFTRMGDAAHALPRRQSSQCKHRDREQTGWPRRRWRRHRSPDGQARRRQGCWIDEYRGWLEDGKRSRGKVYRARGNAEPKELQDRPGIDESLGELFRPVRNIANSIAIGVVASVIAPEVTHAILGPLIWPDCAAPEDRDLCDVVDQAIATEDVVLVHRKKREPLVVVSHDVSLVAVDRGGRKRRIVNIDAHAIVDDDVVLDRRSVDLLESKTIAGW